MAKGMADDARHGERAALVVCVLLSIFLLSLGNAQKLFVAGHMNRFMTAPYHRVMDFIADVGRVDGQNDRLRARIAALEFDIAAGERLLRERNELRYALGFLDAGGVRLEPCEVVKRKFTEEASTVLVRFPEAVNLTPYQPVVSVQGLAGRIREITGANTAWVELITSPSMALCVENSRTGLPGILRPRDNSFELAMVGRDEDVRVGDRIVTSDIAVVYPGLGREPQHAPRGIPVGVVDRVETPPEQIFKTIGVRSYTRMDTQRVLFAVFGRGDWILPTQTDEPDVPANGAAP